MESYYKLHSIYSHYYHDPRKEAVQEAIEHFDEDIHDQIYEKGIDYLIVQVYIWTTAIWTTSIFFEKTGRHVNFAEMKIF